MAGRAHARHPEDHVRCDAPVEPGVVIEHDGEPVAERRRDEGRFRIYVAVDPDAEEEPITVRDDGVRTE